MNKYIDFEGDVKFFVDESVMFPRRRQVTTGSKVEIEKRGGGWFEF